MANNAYIKINTTNKHYRPINNKQITTTNNKQKQNIKQYKPIPPTNHLKNFFTITLTINYHNLLSISLNTLYLH